ncbi:hypothetical protein V8E53_011966 [Lactarius tabidus]
MEHSITPPDLAQAPPTEARRNLPVETPPIIRHRTLLRQFRHRDGERRGVDSQIYLPGPSAHVVLLTPRRNCNRLKRLQARKAKTKMCREQQQPAQEETPVPASRPLSLSPTSIDVLGTLLSVATAAATAASLGSGSSDPLLTSGLALPGMQGIQPSSSPMSDQAHGHDHSHGLSQSSGQSQSRPLSPTPTAGLASRDRVRLRPSSPTSASAPTSPASAPVPTIPPPSPEPEQAPPPSTTSRPTSPVDPRTQLLADMARAFQMGMGLEDTPPGSGTGTGSRSGAGAAGTQAQQASSPANAIEVNLGDGQHRQQQQAEQQQERPPPPEDSFERFLMDLQVDLRRTLEATEPEPEAEPADAAEQEAAADVEPDTRPPLVYPREIEMPASADADADVDFCQGLPALPDDDDDDLLSDDGDELDGDEADDEAEEAPQPQPESRPAPPTQTPRRTVAGSERRSGGGIYWWRMYRFPPMVVAHAHGSAHSPATAPTSTSPPTVAPPSTEANTTTTTAASGEMGTRWYLLSSWACNLYMAMDTRMRTAEEHPPPPPPTLPPPPMPQDPTAAHDNEHAVQEDAAGEAAAETPRDRDRERRWSTRAADALRGFRPASAPASGTGAGAGTARHESTGAGAGSGAGGETGARASDDGHGSTTFFIYVIGGYYPPNHQLVIGTDPLDSFEELAELLGQVKPPTASKEDIDNSGLEIIRSGVLAEYEKIGRIAPICVDRCLICLEDYDPEEDLRLLSCRHVFHRDCVDRWLETGRNNCPACRSQGVSTNGPGPIPIPSSA